MSSASSDHAEQEGDVLQEHGDLIDDMLRSEDVVLRTWAEVIRDVEEDR